MKFLLDTNVVIALLNGRPEGVRSRFEGAGRQGSTFYFAQAALAGEVRADLERQGGPIGAYDVQIAGQALYHGLTLVTANRDEFARVAGLEVIDWSA